MKKKKGNIKGKEKEIERWIGFYIIVSQTFILLTRSTIILHELHSVVKKSRTPSLTFPAIGHSNAHLESYNSKLHN